MSNLERSFRRASGLFFLRVLLGIIFMMQGYGKIFTWGVGQVYDNVFKPFEATWIPVPLLQATAFLSAYVELICGLMLILGLLRQYACIALGILLLIVSYGHGLLEPIWDMHHVYFRASILAALLLLPARWDRWCLDRLIRREKNGDE